MQSTPITGAAKTRCYSTSTHGDTEALTDPDDGDVTAVYRYTAYGDSDRSGTWGEDKPEPDGTEADPTKDVLNPYRYSAKRIDPASGNYDMGFRTYDPGLNQFLSRDMYNGALADLSLGLDPWAVNRYAFAGGNPITRVELDGHRPTMGGEDLTGLRTPHDAANEATVGAAEQWMLENDFEGVVTTDLGDGGRSRNFTGISRDGTGDVGYADMNRPRGSWRLGYLEPAPAGTGV